MARRKSSNKAPPKDTKAEVDENAVLPEDATSDESPSESHEPGDETMAADADAKALKKESTTESEPQETDPVETAEPEVEAPDAQQDEPTDDLVTGTSHDSVIAADKESTTVDPPVATPPDPPKRTVTPMILGGVIAAVLGFVAARGEFLDPLLPPGWRTSGPDTALTEQLEDVRVKLSALQNTVAALPEPEEPVAIDLSPVEGQLSALSQRVEALENRPVVTSSVPQEALNAALADLRATAQSQQDEIDRLLADARLVKEDATAAANATLARAAVTRIQSAVDTGAPFAAALADLETAGETDIPEPLRASAQAGVVTLAELQTTIPDSARAALNAARGADTTGGITGFVQKRLGVRSVEPREGSDPDAVLSRIEAAVRAGRLGDALAEAETLPDAARDALRTWTEQAQARLDAVTAANALAERLSAL